jgi:hypothetical protein
VLVLVLVLVPLLPAAPPPFRAGSSMNVTSVGISTFTAATGGGGVGETTSTDDERAPTRTAITTACRTIEATTQRTPS